ncbi:hypothetical protein Pelo_14279 [Pelomyxa schiedti]|nr:hypothetical protein Pelo_14279 [Pelomyxa schiedti]
MPVTLIRAMFEEFIMSPCYDVVVVVRPTSRMKKVKSDAQRQRKWQCNLVKFTVCPFNLGVIGHVEVVRMPAVKQGGLRFISTTHFTTETPIPGRRSLFCYHLGNTTSPTSPVEFLAESGKMKLAVHNDVWLYTGTVAEDGKNHRWVLCIDKDIGRSCPCCCTERPQGVTDRYKLWKSGQIQSIVIVSLLQNFQVHCILFEDEETAVLISVGQSDRDSTKVHVDFVDVQRSFSLHQLVPSLHTASAMYTIPWVNEKIARAMLMTKANGDAVVVFQTKEHGAVYMVTPPTRCEDVVENAGKLVSPILRGIPRQKQHPRGDMFLSVLFGSDDEGQIWGCDSGVEQQRRVGVPNISLCPPRTSSSTTSSTGCGDVQMGGCGVKEEGDYHEEEEEEEEVRNEVGVNGAAGNCGMVALVRCKAAHGVVLSRQLRPGATQRRLREQQQGGYAGPTRERIRLVDPVSRCVLVSIELVEGQTVSAWYSFRKTFSSKKGFS